MRGRGPSRNAKHAYNVGATKYVTYRWSECMRACMHAWLVADRFCMRFSDLRSAAWPIDSMIAVREYSAALRWAAAAMAGCWLAQNWVRIGTDFSMFTFFSRGACF